MAPQTNKKSKRQSELRPCPDEDKHPPLEMIAERPRSWHFSNYILNRTKARVLYSSRHQVYVLILVFLGRMMRYECACVPPCHATLV